MINKHIHNVSEKELYKAYKLFFNTFSSEVRLKILNLLREKGRNVGEIGGKLEIEQSIASHNLRRLKSCGFVEIKIKGKYRYHLLIKSLTIQNLHSQLKHLSLNPDFTPINNVRITLDIDPLNLL